MIHHLDDVRAGFDVSCDAVVVGSGAGGAVAAENLAAAGMDVVLLEAGPKLSARDKTRDGPMFMARNYFEGGLRMIGGSSQVPSMQGRCLGGSTVVNSAIMFKLPPWVRQIWADEDGLHDRLLDASLERAFDRVMARSHVAPTPMAVMGRKNLLVRGVLTRAGIPSKPLPRAVKGCRGGGACITGCAGEAKQSVDLTYVPGAVRAGARVFTCAPVEAVITEGARAVGVRGHVVDPDGRARLAPFVVRAEQVVMAAGVMATPVILLKSGITGGGLVGKTLYMHLSCAAVGIMEERVDPWIGATQGWGAISPDIQGLKYEALWAPPSLIMVKYGDLGARWLEQLRDAKHVCIVALVYRGACRGRVKANRDGSPNMKLWIPPHAVHEMMRGLKPVVESFLDGGARRVNTGIWGAPDFTSKGQTDYLLRRSIKARHVDMTGNHVFGSCRMSADPKRGPVDPDGKVRGVEGLYVVDSSVFPSPSAVNPQATVMALSDVISRRLAGLEA